MTSVVILWLLLGLFVLYPLVWAALADVHEKRDPRSGEPAHYSQGPEPSPVILEQPAAGGACGIRGHRPGVLLRFHRGAGQPLEGLGYGPGCGLPAPVDLAPVHDGDRDDLLVRAAWSHYLPPAGNQGFHRLRSRKYLVFGNAHVLPDRVPDVEADPQRHRPERRRHGLQPGVVALAGFLDGDAAPDRAGARQCVSLAVCRFPGRFRHTVDPGRKPVPRLTDTGLSADYRTLRPEGRRGAIVRAAGPRHARVPVSTLLGESEVLRHDHGQGGGADHGEERGPMGALPVARRLSPHGRRHSLFLRPALLCVGGDGSGRESRVDAAALPRDLHRGTEGDPRHPRHRGGGRCPWAGCSASWLATWW